MIYNIVKHDVISMLETCWNDVVNFATKSLNAVFEERLKLVDNPMPLEMHVITPSKVSCRVLAVQGGLGSGCVRLRGVTGSHVDRGELHPR